MAGAGERRPVAVEVTVVANPDGSDQDAVLLQLPDGFVVLEAQDAARVAGILLSEALKVLGMDGLVDLGWPGWPFDAGT